MMTLNDRISATLDRWGREAMMFCARHGKAGGEFVTERWANGRVMAMVPGSRANQAIPVEALERLRANGWLICVA